MEPSLRIEGVTVTQTLDTEVWMIPAGREALALRLAVLATFVMLPLGVSAACAGQMAAFGFVFGAMLLSLVAGALVLLPGRMHHRVDVTDTGVVVNGRRILFEALRIEGDSRSLCFYDRDDVLRLRTDLRRHDTRVIAGVLRARAERVRLEGTDEASQAELQRLRAAESTRGDPAGSRHH